jgi:hypothetical protein
MDPVMSFAIDLMEFHLTAWICGWKYLHRDRNQ